MANLIYKGDLRGLGVMTSGKPTSSPCTSISSAGQPCSISFVLLRTSQKAEADCCHDWHHPPLAEYTVELFTDFYYLSLTSMFVEHEMLV